MAVKTTLAWNGDTVSGVWSRPAGRPRTALILAHGAGHGMETRLLVDIAEAPVKRGIAVLRFNFPYTEAGRRAPDPQMKLEAWYRAVADEVAREFGRPFLGGKSMGGRIASHVVAEGFPAGGLVFLGYPLHPPGRPDRIRDSHLGRITAPMLFIQGNRDPFAAPELLHQTVNRLEPAKLVKIEGGDHSFKVKGRAQADVTAELVQAIDEFLPGRPQ